MPWSSLPEGASMQALLTLGDGIHAAYTASYESSGHERFERGQEYYLRLVGERGTLHVLHRWLILCERGRLPRPVRRGPRQATEESELLDQLQGALSEGAEPDSSGRDNLETMAAVEACGRSSRERRWVDPRELLAEARGERAPR
jgi:predicted dehydrogenase